MTSRAETTPVPPLPAGRPRRPALILTLLLLFLVLAVVAVGEGSLASLFNAPSLAIVLGGTAAAVLFSSSWADLQQTWRATLAAFAPRQGEALRELARTMVALAEIARMRGPLALQSHAADAIQPLFLRRGLGLVADGMTEEEVDTLLRLEAHAMAERARQPAAVVQRAAEAAPAMGLIGTLIGLMHMLGRLNDPGAIGPCLAVALLTTFYGAVLANVVLLPLAATLERRAAEQAIATTMMRFAILLIIRRENPRKIEIMLNSLLPPDQQLAADGAP
jgi:chemotaxis protein MotA